MSPASAFVRPRREAMFTADVSGSLVGLLVGSRRSSIDDWRPAVYDITVTSVVACGVSLHIGPWQDLPKLDEVGWPLFGSARAPFVVYVRNNLPELVELRAVVVIAGKDKRSRRRIAR